MTRETYNRIDGLTSQPLLQDLLLKFEELYNDQVEAGDMFDVHDVIDYLAIQMQEYARDTKMDAGGDLREEDEKLKEHFNRFMINKYN